ncbi:cytochrome P450 [Plantactinospora sp. BC1]|uniref:cytochrome P450 n=1 Tax=Plantactinospora sp. BC1 TaxID=2108470 RepID=UPI001F3EBBD8|nr:cytochrome P450 [Plantactinospora sp. BC1]
MVDSATFALRLYRRRAEIAYHGFARRDPMALLETRPGRVEPYRLYDRMRAVGPIVPTCLGNWAATGHRVCNQVLRDRRFGVQGLGATVGTSPTDLSFVDRDPPEHTRLRRLAAPDFSQRRVAGYRPRIEETAARLVERAAGRGSFDLVTAIAAPLPITVIADLLGVTGVDEAAFARYGLAIGGALDGVRSVRQLRGLVAARAEVDAIFTGLVARRRREPGDDLVSRLVAAEEEISSAELLAMCTLLLIAGFETTVNLIGNAVHALLDHPEQWALLRADPSLAAAVVEETLRYDAPVQRAARVAHEEIEVAGAVVRPNDWVITLLGAANRDPEVYPHPDRFDITRGQVTDHLAFSSGIHYCLGASLARLEGEVALATIAERLDLVPAGRVSRRRSATIRGFLRLPVAVRGRRARSASSPGSAGAAARPERAATGGAAEGSTGGPTR